MRSVVVAVQTAWTVVDILIVMPIYRLRSLVHWRTTSAHRMMVSGHFDLKKVQDEQPESLAKHPCIEF